MLAHACPRSTAEHAKHAETSFLSACSRLTARGESLAAFDGRCIPAPPQRGCRVGDPAPPQRGCRVGDPAGCVAPRSNTPGILGRRALPSGRLARLGATPDFRHGLLTTTTRRPTKTRRAFVVAFLRRLV